MIADISEAVSENSRSLVSGREYGLREQSGQVFSGQSADHAVLLRDDRLGQLAFRLLQVEDLRFDRVTCDQGVSDYFLVLADAVRPVASSDASSPKSRPGPSVVRTVEPCSSSLSTST